MKKDEAKKKIEDGLKALEKAISEGRSEEFERYLAVMSRFHRYSFGNTMLILLQRPEATHVAGYTRWQELGRQVKKGESGIGILAPLRYKVENEDGEDGSVIKGFKVVHVFDVSQTEGEELPEFAVAKGEPGENLARIEAAIGKEGIRLIEVDDLGGANGTSAGGEIQILSTLSRAERCRVLCHEWAHERLHHSERRHETTKTVRECEAEAVAFVVCNALAIDALKRSADYIQLYRGNTDTLSESLEFIQKTAAHILDAIEKVELGCNHTLHLDAPDSTWAGVAVDGGTRFECRVCKRFFGFQSESVQSEALELAPPASPDEEEEEPNELRIGRADFEERREARIERLHGRAETARNDANETHEQARSMASRIPFGQPILVGHHSEKRDRNYRERIHNKFGKAFELAKKAEHYDGKAESAESNRAISSDDPEAISKLKEKLQRLEELQEHMKRLNAAWRKAKKPKSDDVEGWAKVAQHLGVEPESLERTRKAMVHVKSFSGRDGAPCAPYQLQNNNAEIRRVKERIKELQEEGRVTETTEGDHGICSVVENVEVNRIQLVFPGKPPDDVRKTLKQNGFRWSRNEGAWQRQLNDAGRHAATWVLQQIRKEEETDAEAQSERATST